MHADAVGRIDKDGRVAGERRYYDLWLGCWVSWVCWVTGRDTMARTLWSLRGGRFEGSYCVRAQATINR
jgi:hypothetical protein